DSCPERNPVVGWAERSDAHAFEAQQARGRGASRLHPPYGVSVLLDLRCQTATRNRPRLSSAPRLAVVFPALPAGFYSLGKPRGGSADWGFGISVQAPTGAC